MESSDTSDKTAICYLDLLGTRSASGDESAFSRRNFEFARALESGLIRLSTDKDNQRAKLSVNYFSDGFYAEASDVHILADYLTMLRCELAPQKYYFKASLGLGKLNANPINKAVGNRKLITLCGTSFGPNAGKRYEEQESLKGVGIYVHKDVQKCLAKRLVPSCYVESGTHRSLKGFMDIKIPDIYMTEQALQGLLEVIIRANGQKKTYGRHYVALLVTMINSFVFDSNDANHQRCINRLVYIVESGAFEKMFGELHGREAVYYALLNQTFANHDKSKMGRIYYGKIREYFRTHRRLIGLRDAMPPEVLGNETREKCLNSMFAEDIVVGRHEYRAVAQRLEDHCRSVLNLGKDQWPTPAQMKDVLEAMVDKDINGIRDKLKKDKEPCPSGNDWTISAINGERKRILRSLSFEMGRS